MGVAATNMSVGKDYSTNKNIAEIHIQFPLLDADADAIKGHLENGRIQEAFDVLRNQNHGTHGIGNKGIIDAAQAAYERIKRGGGHNPHP